jgi:exopolyphosphatase / guanosine-5'-triphosphate,3'-diphosphate pyrophosphatase
MGKKKPAIIASSDLKEYITSDKTYLYVDVGGGSTEFSLFSNGKIIASKSFKNGTVRLLNNMVNEIVWKKLKNGLKHIPLLLTKLR